MNLCFPSRKDADLAVLKNPAEFYAQEISSTQDRDAGLESLQGCNSLLTLNDSKVPSHGAYEGLVSPKLNREARSKLQNTSSKLFLQLERTTEIPVPLRLQRIHSFCTDGEHGDAKVQTSFKVVGALSRSLGLPGIGATHGIDLAEK